MHVAIYAQGIHSGQEAKRQKDKDQTQASGEEKQTQTNAGASEPNGVRAGDCDLSQPPGFLRCLVEGGPPTFIFGPQLMCELLHTHLE